MTGPNAGPTGDDAAWEAAAAVAQDTPSLPTTVPAASTAEALATIALAAQFNVDRLAMLTLRLLGLSYAEIGALCGKTKQAVAKDVAAVELMQPEIGRLVRAAFSVRLPMAERMAEHIATMGEAGKRTYRGMPVRLKRAVLAATYHVELTKGGRLTGANGVYGRVAARLGLRSWNTARVLMQRAADCCKMCKE